MESVIDSLKYIIDFWLSIDYMATFKNIISFFSNGDSQFSFGLIGFEVTLLTIYFVFLPLIIQNKENEIYLGHKKIKWILFERKKNKKITNFILKIMGKKNTFSDMCLNWIYNIFLLLLSIILYLVKWYLIVIVLFFVFIICMSIKVVDYLSLVSSDYCDNEIEKQFLIDCLNKKEYVCDMLQTNITNDLSDNRKTLKFILENYDKNNVDVAYKAFYKVLFNKNNSESIYMLFEEIAKAINKNENTMNLFIQPWDIDHFLVNCMYESNSDNFREIIYTLLSNSIKLSIIDNNNYNEIFDISYGAITKNTNISEDTRNNFLRMILDNIKYFVYDQDNKENDFIKYKYIFNLFKYFINTKNKMGIDFMISNIESTIDLCEKIYSSILITSMIYLYYLMVVEISPYVNDDEKEYLSTVKEKLNEVVKSTNIQYSFNLEVNELFNWIDDVSNLWERFIFDNSNSCVKTPLVDDALITAKRSLAIFFSQDVIKTIKDINDKDLDIFRYTIENGFLKNDVIKNIKDFILFIGFELDDEVINDYVEKLLDYVNSRDRNKPEIYNDLDYFKESFKLKEEYINSEMQKLSIFNSNENIKCEKFWYPLPTDKEMLETLIKNDFFKWVKLDSILEKTILNKLSKIDLNKVEYSYNTEKNIFKKLKLLHKDYYYIRPSNDNLGAEYKFGNEYSKCISKFKIINTSIGIKRFVIDNYKCQLKNIYFEVRELNVNEIKIFIKKYKIGKEYIVKNNYGFDIKYKKKEIEEYCKNKYIGCFIWFEIGLDIEKSKGYEFVRTKKEVI